LPDRYRTSNKVSTRNFLCLIFYFINIDIPHIQEYCSYLSRMDPTQYIQTTSGQGRIHISLHLRIFFRPSIINCYLLFTCPAVFVLLPFTYHFPSGYLFLSHILAFLFF
jgi:hypothetical protein